MDSAFFTANFKKDVRLSNVDYALKKAIKAKLPNHFFIFHYSSYIHQYIFTYKNSLKINPLEGDYFYQLLLKKKFNFTDKLLEKFLKDNFSFQEKYFSIYPIVLKKKNVFSLVTNKNLNQEEQNFLTDLAEKFVFFYDYFKIKKQVVIHKSILDIHTVQQFWKCFKKEIEKNISLNKLWIFLKQNKELTPLSGKKIPLEISEKIDLEKLKKSKENCYLQELTISKSYPISPYFVITFPLNERDDMIFYLEKKTNDYFDDWEIAYILNWRESFQKHLVKKFAPLKSLTQYSFSSKTKKFEMLFSNNLQKDILQDDVILSKKNFKVSRLSYFAFLVEDDSFFQQKKNLHYCLHHYFSLEDLLKNLLIFQQNDMLAKDYLDDFFLLDVESNKDKLQIISSKKIQIYSFSFKTGELVTSKTSFASSVSLDAKAEFLNYSWNNLEEQNLLLFFDSTLKKEMIKVIKEKLILLGDLTLTILMKELKQDKKLTINCFGLIKII